MPGEFALNPVQVSKLKEITKDGTGNFAADMIICASRSRPSWMIQQMLLIMIAKPTRIRITGWKRRRRSIETTRTARPAHSSAM
ncbi:hypothetical protein DUT91_24240 [Phyllobacterium salinisoli]|uniref:Uncharacterized protein n=1 Tax=Phyllobacterium salinisoli TaxID=1899321 RepID=A0A368JX04_9HYPH|nr:hypothetical protein DUT91_24240 [Phyllobacterium salinisoli]